MVCFSQFDCFYMINEWQRWDKAVFLASDGYKRLTAGQMRLLENRVAFIQELKTRLLDMAMSAGSSETCCECGGSCCLFGKYHFTVLDLFSFWVCGLQVVEPDFSHPDACPYGGVGGCKMKPSLRPVACVLFNCEPIEERMGPALLEEFSAAEHLLKRCVKEVEEQLALKVGRPLLMIAD